ASDPLLFHSLGMFIATFVYSLTTLAWIDRGGSGAVPLFSTGLVVVLLIVSMILFCLLVQRVGDLQITSVLRLVGDQGREVIRTTFQRLDDVRELKAARPAGQVRLGPATQSVRFAGSPRAIAELDLKALVAQAQQADGVIVMACAVGDTVVDDSLLMRVHG